MDHVCSRVRAQCGRALGLPGVYLETALHSKLLARKMEALLECQPPDTAGAAAAYQEARRLGLLRLKGTSRKFESLVVRRGAAAALLLHCRTRALACCHSNPVPSLASLPLTLPCCLSRLPALTPSCKWCTW